MLPPVALVRQFDTNGDGQMNEAEQQAAQANTTAVQQLQTLDQTINQTQAPIQLARVYAIEQIAMQYGAAVQQVVSANNIAMIVTPASVVYASDAADVTVNDGSLVAAGRFQYVVVYDPSGGFVTGGGAVTVTGFVAVAVAPSLSVTVRVTV